MFPTSTPFATANAALAKKPVYIVEIEGYARAFSTLAGLGTFTGLSPTIPIQSNMRANPGGATTYPNTVSFPNPTPAGNLIFAFMRIGDGGTSPGISDTAGSSWTLLYTDNATVAIWYAVSAGTPANNTIFMDSYAGGTGTNANCQFYAVEVSSSYSGFTHSTSPATGTSALASATVGGNTLNVALSAGATWNLYLIALAPATSTFTGVNLGFLWNFGSPSDPTQLVMSDAPFSSLVQGVQTTGYDWIVTLDDLKETISDLDGGSNLSDCVFNVQDTGRQITSDLASFVFEGKLMKLLHGYQGMNLVDYATLFTGVVNTVESDNGNNEYKFTCSPKNLTKLSAKIFTTGNNATLPVSSNNPLTLSAHPLDLLVTALQQAGVVLSDIDTTKIYFYRDNLFSGLLFEFTLTSAPTAKDFIENELMKPLGMYIRENNLATITVNSFYPALSGAGAYTPPSLPVKTLTIDEHTDVPIPGDAPLVNQVITKFDDDGTGNQKFNAENIANYDASIAKYGLVGGQTIESQGLKSSFQGYLISDIVSFLIFLRYGLKNLVIDPLPCTWDNVTLEPGDIIALTEPYVPDRKAGVLGITAQTFEILDRNWKLMDGIAEFKLLAIDLTKFKQYLITPNAEPDYASDTAPNQAKYLYLCDAAGKYSTGAPANTLG